MAPDPDIQSPVSDAAEMMRGEDHTRGFKLLLGVSVVLSVGIAVLALWVLGRVSADMAAQMLG